MPAAIQPDSNLTRAGPVITPISQMRRLRLREVSGSLKGLELSLGPGPSDSSTLFLTT